MSEQDGGMLGDLPRSRPGRRSAKREAPSRPSPGTPRSRAARAESGAPPSPSPTPGRPAEAEIVIGAARAAAGVARTGLQAASRIAGGVLGRLPRP